MKLEDLAIEPRVEPLHKAGDSTLSLIKNGQKFTFLIDRASGEIERKYMGSISMHPEIGHGMGAVCD